MELLTLLLSCVVHIILILLFEGIFLFAILYPILTRVSNNMTTKYREFLHKQILMKGYGNAIAPIKILIKACSIDEDSYNRTQKIMPYLMYAILLFVLIVCGVIIVIISNKFNVKINYWFVLLNSIISFALICGYAFVVLWFILATQPYQLNLEGNIYKVLNESYASA